ncbi:SET domain-containing protein [Deminuibacter soli]|uniref:SET domain-containing protein n=1 Tax=Deminuibacter soli TaxID=2291815 RepID=A0A3E1NLW7_9BACT|nr:SET domain-containing protein [Deminuibacter soli]RFM28892.1 SET domain-containing protein [Deminuibacter soli]
MILPFLFVAPSEKGGRGVFTSKKIPVGTVLEISPVLVLTAKERATIEDTKLYNYIFEWGDNRKQAGLALGYISMYNHDYKANCVYEMDYENALMTIKTVKPIAKGDELCINYNADPDDETLVWFHQ